MIRISVGTGSSSNNQSKSIYTRHPCQGSIGELTPGSLQGEKISVNVLISANEDLGKSSFSSFMKLCLETVVSLDAFIMELWILDGRNCDGEANSQLFGNRMSFAVTFRSHSGHPSKALPQSWVNSRCFFISPPVQPWNPPFHSPLVWNSD